MSVAVVVQLVAGGDQQRLARREGRIAGVAAHVARSQSSPSPSAGANSRGVHAPLVARAAARRRAVDDRLAVGGVEAAERQQRRADLAEALQQRVVVGQRAEQRERLDVGPAAHEALRARRRSARA